MVFSAKLTSYFADGSIKDRVSVPPRCAKKGKGRIEHPWMREERCRLGASPTVGKRSFLNRKEVIQPHFPVRLPCYDFTPLTRHTFGTVFRFRFD